MALKLHDWAYLLGENEEEGEPCGSPLFTVSSSSHTSSQTIVPQSHWPPPKDSASVWAGAFCHRSRPYPLPFTPLAVLEDRVGPGPYAVFILYSHCLSPQGNKIQLHEIGAYEK